MENYLNYKFKIKVYFFYNLYFYLFEIYMYREVSRVYISVRKKGFRLIYNLFVVYLVRNVLFFYNCLKCCLKISFFFFMKNKLGVIVFIKIDNF